MTGRLQRIFRRRAPDAPRGSASRPKAGLGRLRPRGGTRAPWGKRAAPEAATPWYKRLPSGGRRAREGATPWYKRLPFVKRPAARAPRHALQPGHGGGEGASAVTTAEVVEAGGTASFRDRGRLRRRLRFLRRARELAFRDVGGLMFDMRRFGRDRPDLLDAKLAALGAVDRELRALERVLDDRRPIHELHEPGLSSCPRCGALHASEDNFCPRCGLQFGGAQAMGEVGGAIAAPPQPPPPPVETPTAATLAAPARHGAGARGAAEARGDRSADAERQTEISRPRDAP